MQTYTSAHWHAGALGHVLYLEATAADMAACGFGCFVDSGTSCVLRPGVVNTPTPAQDASEDRSGRCSVGGADTGGVPAAGDGGMPSEWSANGGAFHDRELGSMPLRPLYHVAVGSPDGDRGAVPLTGDDDRATASVLAVASGHDTDASTSVDHWSEATLRSSRVPFVLARGSADMQWRDCDHLPFSQALRRALFVPCKSAAFHTTDCTKATRPAAVATAPTSTGSTHYSVDDSLPDAAASVGAAEGAVLPPRVHAQALVDGFGEVWDATAEPPVYHSRPSHSPTAESTREARKLVHSLRTHGYAVLSLDTAVANDVVSGACGAAKAARQMADEFFNGQPQCAKDSLHTENNLGYVRYVSRLLVCRRAQVGDWSRTCVCVCVWDAVCRGCENTCGCDRRICTQ